MFGAHKKEKKKKKKGDSNGLYYMAGSASGQDEGNPVLGLSCPVGIARFIPAKARSFGVIFWPYNKSFIDQACSVKMTAY